MMNSSAFERAIKLAVVSGLRAAMGPALLAAAQNRPERKNLALAAMGEMVIDKLPFIPSRSTLPLLVPRALAGAWVARESFRDEGIEEPWAAPIGAAVAVGAATMAPMIRGALHTILGIPQPILGLAEDYLALRLGSESVGLSIEDLEQIGSDSVGDIRDQIMPVVDGMRGKLMPA